MSPNNAYRRGMRYEKRSRAWFESLGAYVLESKGSHGLWDGVAIFPRHIVLYQVKATDRAMNAGDRAKLQMFNAPENARKELHRWQAWAREPTIEIIARA